MSNLYLISGCNGAGKTTASFTILPEMLGCREFVNTDEIARGLSPFQPEKVAVEAGRIMLQRIEYLLNKQKISPLKQLYLPEAMLKPSKRPEKMDLILHWFTFG